MFQIAFSSNAGFLSPSSYQDLLMWLFYVSIFNDLDGLIFMKPIFFVIWRLRCYCFFLPNFTFKLGFLGTTLGQHSLMIISYWLFKGCDFVLLLLISFIVLLPSHNFPLPQMSFFWGGGGQCLKTCIPSHSVPNKVIHLSQVVKLPLILFTTYQGRIFGLLHWRRGSWLVSLSLPCSQEPKRCSSPDFSACLSQHTTSALQVGSGNRQSGTQISWSPYLR